MLKGAIFDMDGLMFDTERIYRDTWVLLAGMYGVPHNPEFPKAVCGTSGNHMAEVIHTYYPTVDATDFRDDCLRIVDETIQKGVPIKKGLFEILNGMKANGVKMAVASSSQPGLIRRNLRNAGIEEYFDAVVSGVEVENGKPAPDIFLYAAEKIGIDPAQCYVFEDGLNGIRAGAAAGCTVIMIPDLTEPTDEIRALCSGIYEDLGAAMRALQRCHQARDLSPFEKSMQHLKGAARSFFHSKVGDTGQGPVTVFRTPPASWRSCGTGPGRPRRSS